MSKIPISSNQSGFLHTGLGLISAGALALWGDYSQLIATVIIVSGLICVLFFIWSQVSSGNKKSQSGNPLQLIFPLEDNKESVISNLKLSTRFLIPNEKVPDNKSFHTFFLGVSNTSDVTTVKKVKLRIQSLDPNRCGALVDKNLTIKDKPEQVEVDVSPHEDAFFLLGRGWDETKRGWHSPTLCSRSEYEQAVSQFGTCKFLLKSHSSVHRLLPNDGLRFRVTIYANDLPSKPYILTLNLKETIEVIIKPEILPC